MGAFTCFCIIYIQNCIAIQGITFNRVTACALCYLIYYAQEFFDIYIYIDYTYTFIVQRVCAMRISRNNFALCCLWKNETFDFWLDEHFWKCFFLLIKQISF